MEAQTTRRVCFVGPTNQVGGNALKSFEAGTRVEVRLTKSGRYELRVRGTLWTAQTNHLAFEKVA